MMIHNISGLVTAARKTAVATLQDLLAGVGLYLTEPVEVRQELAGQLGADWDQKAFALYETLVKRDPKSVTPLSLIPT